MEPQKKREGSKTERGPGKSKYLFFGVILRGSMHAWFSAPKSATFSQFYLFSSSGNRQHLKLRNFISQSHSSAELNGAEPKRDKKRTEIKKLMRKKENVKKCIENNEKTLSFSPRIYKPGGQFKEI